MVANIWPMKPAGVQLISPIRPPGRTTRTSSSAACLVVRGEHDAHARDGRVELGVGVRQVLGVVHLPAQRDTCGGRGLAAGLDQVRREVAGHDVGARLGGGDRRVAGAGRDVEDVLARADAGGGDERRAERGDHLGRNGRVVAHRPHGRVLGLECDVVGGGGGWVCCVCVMAENVRRVRPPWHRWNHPSSAVPPRGGYVRSGPVRRPAGRAGGPGYVRARVAAAAARADGPLSPSLP